MGTLKVLLNMRNMNMRLNIRNIRKLHDQGTRNKNEGGTRVPSNFKNEAIKEEFYVPKFLIGLVIGKGGENIRRIKQETQCNICIAKASRDQPTQLFTLTGMPHNVQAAKKQINDRIPNSNNEAIKEEFYVPKSKVAIVIGKSAENINRMEQETQCSISIAKDNKDELPRLCTLKGMPQNVQAAKEQINNLIKHDNFQIEEFYVPKSVVRLLIGISGENINRMQQETQCIISIDKGSKDDLTKLCTITGMPQNVKAAKEQINNLIKHDNFENEAIKEELYIPKRMVGILIGNSGENIFRMEQETQCSINIANGSKDGLTRLCTLIGMPHDVHAAKKQINNLIKQDNFKEKFCVPIRLVGLLIGNGGENIRRMKIETQCDISIEKYSKDDLTQLCTITGMPQNVQAAKEQINNILKSANSCVTSKGVNSPALKGPLKVPDLRRESEVKNPEAEETTSYSTTTNQGKKERLRPIIIDGSNIAYYHGKFSKFSIKGILMIIEYFEKRGHQTIIAFLPQYRLGSDLAERSILSELERKDQVVFTPSRKVGEETISSYDDRFILDFAKEFQGIVVSRDNYRDIYEDSEQHRETIEKRILMPTFIGDTLMFPDDPLGRDGPRLDEFLRFETPTKE